MRSAVALELIKTSTASMVIGVDEVGYGSWAGPLVVCAVAVQRGWSHPDVKDSKKVRAPQRKALVRGVLSNLTARTVFRYHGTIDKIGLLEAWREAAQEAITEVQRLHPDSLVVVDGLEGVHKLSGVISLPKADSLVPAVSAASIIAKVTRDEWMITSDEIYPGYGFKTNVGYGTKFHHAALKRLGPCAIHRRSFAPIKQVADALGIK